MRTIIACLLLFVISLPLRADDAEEIRPVEEGPEEDVAEGVSRRIYRLNVESEEKRSFVLAIYEEVVRTKVNGEMRPVTKVIETLIYCPSGTHAEMVSLTKTWPPVEERKGRTHGPCVVTGFGQFREIPDLDYSAESQSGVPSEHNGKRIMNACHVGFIFEDNDDNPSKSLHMVFRLQVLSLQRAMQLLMDRRMAMPEQKSRGWEITLPPKPDALAAKPDGGKKAEK